MYFLAYPFANLLLLLYTFLGNSTVAAIAVLTLLISLLTLPLTLGQQKSSRKMQEFQPELEKLQKKHAKDKEKLAQEQMKMYKEAGINPMSGCLPLLIQMPIWFGLIGAIKYCIPSTPLDLFTFSQHIYKWLPGVVGIVPLQSTFLGMDLGQPPSPAQWWSYALPILVFATYWLQQKLVTPPTAPSSGDDKSQGSAMAQQMQMMQTTMPLMMMFFTLSYPTGLSIYFIISSLIRVAQYYFIKTNGAKTEDNGKTQLKPRKQ
ncbi:MAG: YidC/Oxa1 family membrane protein insertase [Chloroflexi bacterium]|nr:YidC/Oxa1 family membrane protein insertase [Chloroflexota bacterium]